MTRESQVEAYFVEQWTKLGGITRKIKYIGRRDAPDRFAAVIGWNGLVEVKAPGEKPRASQKAEFTLLEFHGTNVVVLSSYDEVNKFILTCKRLRDREHRRVKELQDAKWD